MRLIKKALLKEMVSPNIYAKIQPCKYLIQKDKQKVYIHRQLSPGERHFYRHDEIFFYKSNFYLHGIKVCNTLEEAEDSVKDYWLATKNFKKRNEELNNE